MTHYRLAREASVDVHDEAAAWEDWYTGNGTRYTDWDAGFRTWLRNAKRFNRGAVAASGTDGRSKHDFSIPIIED